MVITGIEETILALGATIASNAGTIATVGGSVLSGLGAVAQGYASKNAAEAEAAQEQRQASEARAASQRNAAQKQQQAQYALSRGQAVAAASGGGATDPTVLNLQGNIAQQGELQVENTLYEGEARGSALDYQAAVKRAAGRQAVAAGWVGGGASVLRGVSDWAKYRRGFYGPTGKPLSLDYTDYTG